MNKRHVLLLTAVLGMAAPSALAQTESSATVSTASRDAALSTRPVSVNTGSYRGPLSVLLTAVAKAAGYDVVFNFNVDALALIDGGVVSSEASAAQAAPAASYTSAVGKPTELAAKPIAFNFVQRPFNEIWPLLMDVYELQYDVVKVGNSEVIRIGQRPAQLAVSLRHITAKYAEQKALEFFGKPIYSELPIYGAEGKVVDKVRQFDRYVLEGGTMRILADLENNRLIAGGTAEETAKIRSFVATIDIPKQAVTAIPQGEVYYTVKGNAADVVTVLKSQYPDLKVVPVGQTGQLIITGSQADLVRAQNALNNVDKAPVAAAPTTVQRVFQLVNASAEEVKATLEGTLAREISTNVLPNVPITATDVTGNPVTLTVPNTQGKAQTEAQAAVTAAQQASAQTGEATIIADRRTNTIIVRGTPTQVQQVAELIPQLDQVVPQINVQVRIQEVTDRALTTLGMKTNVSFGGFNLSIGGTTGLGATFDPTRTFLGFNIFPTLTALETQGQTRRIYDGNVTMQSGQRAIGQQGSTQNASSVAAATIKSGGQILINIPSVAGNIEKAIDYGVVLDFINPQVAPDGTITMRVRGQVNNPDKIPDTGIPNIMTFTNSEAQSTVTFKSGQTILMSGLMGVNDTSSKNGVPLLSSIPVLGALTGQQQTNKQQTQLLVIVTGSVVK